MIKLNNPPTSNTKGIAESTEDLQRHREGANSQSRVNREMRNTLRQVLRADAASALVGILALFIILTSISPYFLTSNNLTNVLVQTSVVALLAGGQTFVILIGGIDLSVAAVTALCGSTIGMLTIRYGLDPYLGILLGLAIGMAVGLFNGWMVAKIGLPAFIITLGGYTMWRGLAFQVTGGYDISGMSAPIVFLGQGKLGSIPMPIIVMLCYYIVAFLVLRHTRLGRYTYALGSNEEAARRAGIPVARYKMAVYIVCGFSVGLAAMVLIGRLDSSGGKLASGWELDAIAAVILGGTSLFGGRGNILGSLLGALLMTIIRNGMNLLGISPFLQMITLGAVIVGAVWLDVIRLRSFNRIPRILL